MKNISSTSNPLVKEILELQSKSRLRKSSGKFVIEGLNELKLCLLMGYSVETLLFQPQILSLESIAEWVGPLPKSTEIIEVNQAVFNKIAYRKDVKNAVAIVAEKKLDFHHLVPNEPSVILVLEGLEKPGNLGAVLRTADALQADAVLLSNSLVDLFNPNVIRGSVGTAFTVPVVSSDNDSVYHYLLQNKYSIFTTFMESSLPAWDIKYPKRTAIVVGTESNGISDFWRGKGTTNVNIPMTGKVDSLNVSVAVSVMLYEVRRQFQLFPKI